LSSAKRKRTILQRATLCSLILAARRDCNANKKFRTPHSGTKHMIKFSHLATNIPRHPQLTQIQSQRTIAGLKLFFGPLNSASFAAHSSRRLSTLYGENHEGRVCVVGIVSGDGGAEYGCFRVRR
jgi:hypothetical protein